MLPLNARKSCAPCSLKCFIVGALKRDEPRIKRSPKKLLSPGSSAPVQFPPPPLLRTKRRTALEHEPPPTLMPRRGSRT